VAANYCHAIETFSNDMKTLNSIRTTAMLLMVGVAAPAQLVGQSWETILTYQSAPGRPANARDIDTHPSGAIFASGGGTDASGVFHGLVLKSDIADENWYLSDDTKPADPQFGSNTHSVTFDSLGNLYSVGQIHLLPSTSGIAYWHVRKSSDLGLSWSSVDTYQYSPGEWVNPTGCAGDNLGNIYVAGWARGADTRKTTGPIHWIVRKSSDQGQTWSLVDDITGSGTPFAAEFIPGAGIFVVGDEFTGSTSSRWRVRRSQTGGSNSWSNVDLPQAVGAAQGVGSDGLGNIYVAGTTFITTQPAKGAKPAVGYFAWTTRKSSDGGTTWSTADLLGDRTYAGAVGKDNAGTAVIVGRATDSLGINHWLVRRFDPLAGWQTIDDFQPAPGFHAAAAGVAVDAAGNLLVSGFGYAPDGSGQQWIVRKLAPTAP
jgi:hypothetical protein